MMLANEELRVLLVTIHVALADVIARITPEAELTSMRLADRACRQMGIAHPRVAVAGLNPHAGEGGKFGREDIDIIEPAIAAARAEGIDASGPWPGDTIFMRARRGEFDIVVAQYHDQGLIPVKYLGLDPWRERDGGSALYPHQCRPRHRLRHRRQGGGRSRLAGGGVRPRARHDA